MSADKVGLNENNKLDDYEKSFEEAIRELEDFVEIPIRVDRSAGESLLIYLENTFFAKGEVTILEDTFAVRITEINDPRQV